MLLPVSTIGRPAQVLPLKANTSRETVAHRKALIAAAPSSTHSPPSLLLYIPVHVSETTEDVRRFAECLFGMRPSLLGTQFDVLLSVTGRALDGRQDELRAILRKAASAQPGLRPPVVHSTFTSTQDDTYALGLADAQRKNTSWVSGPNAAFYGAFLNGSVHNSHVRNYKLVQQLETDVCAMQPGWLDVVVEPMLRDPGLIVSGAALSCDCVYDAIHDTCEPMANHLRDGDHLLRHVNGNAMYRPGRQLQHVLSVAAAKYGHTEPFDLAIYWTMKDLGMLHRLHTNPRYLNVPCKVDRLRFAVPGYHGVADAVLVHSPRRLRTSSFGAVASRASNKHTQSHKKVHVVTLVGLTHAPLRLLSTQQTGLASRFINNVVYAAADPVTFYEASKLVPRQIVAAFDEEVEQRLRSKQPVPDESWPPSSTAAGSIATTVAKFVQAGHSVFLIGPEAVPLTNYGGLLTSLDEGSVHVLAGPAPPLAYTTAGAIEIGMLYAPAGAGVATVLDEWASGLRSGRTDVRLTGTPATPVATLPPTAFVHGGPMLQSGWPATTRSQRAVVSVDAGRVGGLVNASSGLTIFQMRHARLWPLSDKARCANYSVLSRRPFNITTYNAATVLGRHAEFARFVAANRIECAVVPGLGLPATRSRTDTFKLVDFDAFKNASGGAVLLPAATWVRRPARRIAFVSARGHTRGRLQRSTDIYGSPSTRLLSRPLHRAVQAVTSSLGSPYVCVYDAGRSLDEVAMLSLTRSRAVDGWVSALRRAHGAFYSHHRILLTGAWNAVQARDVTSAPDVATLADLTDGPITFNSLMPALASTSSVLSNAAWLDVVEGLVCTGANAVITAAPSFAPPLRPSTIVDAMMPYIAPSCLDRDLARLRAWRTRPDRPKLSRPPMVAVASAGQRDTAVQFLHTVADVQPGRGVVLVGRHTRDARDPPRMYDHASALPPLVVMLSFPRLALAARHGADWVPFKAVANASYSITALHYAAEVAFAKRWARRWARSTVWRVEGSKSVNNALALVRATPRSDGVVTYYL